MGYDDSEDLRELYWGKNMSQAEIADRFGVNPGTIHYWMDKYGIRTRDRISEMKNTVQRKSKGDRLLTDGKGYECWRYGHHKRVKIHRLMAVAKFGFEKVIDNDVHHSSRIPWDNRMENITVLSPGVHSKNHAAEQERLPGGEWK